MENQKNNKGIIALLIVIILILSALCVLFATGTISFNSNKLNDNSKTEETKTVKEEVQENDDTVLTENEAKLVLNNLYNEAVRHIYNQAVTYCGETATDEKSFMDENYLIYDRSVSFKTVKELKTYLKNFMTDSLLSNSRVSIKNAYYEKDDNLYCNTYGKGSNLELATYLVDESTFNVSNIRDDSFDGFINAVYYAAGNTDKSEINIKVSVIKENNKWLLNTYEEIN